MSIGPGQTLTLTLPPWRNLEPFDWRGSLPVADDAASLPIAGTRVAYGVPAEPTADDPGAISGDNYARQGWPLRRPRGILVLVVNLSLTDALRAALAERLKAAGIWMRVANGNGYPESFGSAGLPLSSAAAEEFEVTYQGFIDDPDVFPDDKFEFTEILAYNTALVEPEKWTGGEFMHVSVYAETMLFKLSAGPVANAPVTVQFPCLGVASSLKYKRVGGTPVPDGRAVKEYPIQPEIDSISAALAAAYQSGLYARSFYGAIRIVMPDDVAPGSEWLDPSRDRSRSIVDGIVADAGGRTALVPPTDIPTMTQDVVSKILEWVSEFYPEV